MHEAPRPIETDGEPPDEATSPAATGSRRSVSRVVGPLVLVALMIGVAVLAMLSRGAPPVDHRACRTSRRRGPRDGGCRPGLLGSGTHGRRTLGVRPGPGLGGSHGARLGGAGSSRPWPRSWQVSEDGHRLTFTLRPGITFSDGTPITAQDVVASWLRVIDPVDPSPLSGLLTDVTGAARYLAGPGAPRIEVGIHAVGDTVVVDFDRPASWFPAAAASPTLAIVPASLARRRRWTGAAGRTWWSRARTCRPRQDEKGFLLTANPALLGRHSRPSSASGR